MNKICTSIEQSKKLIELGLDINTTDMYYQRVLPKEEKIEHNPKVGNPIELLDWYNKGYTHFGNEPLKLEEYCIPAWSLSALLELMPYYSLERIEPDSKYYNEDYPYACYSCKYSSKMYKDSLDAVFETICWLLENKKL